MPALTMSSLPTDSLRRHADDSTTATTNGIIQDFFSSSHHPLTLPATAAYSSAAESFTNSALPFSSHGASVVSSAATKTTTTTASARVLPVERLRLRDWLVRMIETKEISGLFWLDKERQIVKIPWKHAARHGWSRDKDACLFRSWAIHTKKYDPKTDTPKANPKVWKANFRCAINSLPDIEELKEKGKSKGNDAYKVYRLHPRKSKRQCREGSNVTRRPRSTCRSRLSKHEKRRQQQHQQQEQSRAHVNADTSENQPRFSSHSTGAKTTNPSAALAETLLRQRMQEIGNEHAAAESAKEETVSVNFQCFFKQNCTNPSSTQLPPMLLTDLSSANVHNFPSSHGISSSTTTPLTAHAPLPGASSASPPCSTTTSTPASTPQTPPPSYLMAMSQRAGTSSWSMEARLQINDPAQANTYDSYNADEYSDSDCSRMTEAEVADMVLDIAEQSPGNSPRCFTPPDGNNNMGAGMGQGDYWPQDKGGESKIFFGNNFDMMDQPPRTMESNKPPMYHPEMAVCSTADLMPAIKVEPDAYPSSIPQQLPSLRYAYPAGHDATPQMNHCTGGPTSYVLHNL